VREVGKDPPDHGGKPDPFHLQRFVAAQGGGVYEQALAELKAGRKQGHWMWFIFPQHRDLGRSATARYYGLSGEDEARAYLAHPLLGPRLHECFAALRPHLQAGLSAEAMLGKVDAMKLRSCAALFGVAAREFAPLPSRVDL
jgi:uncharacterized protein (DUF1810 family)